MNGLELIKHSGGGGVMTVSSSGAASHTLEKNGKVKFSGVTNVDLLTVSDCFSSAYDNYLVVWRATVASGNPPLNVQLTSSGTPANAINYTHQRLYADGTSVSGVRSSDSRFHFGQVGGGKYNGAHLYFYGPSLSQPTAARSVTAWGTDDARIDDVAGTHSEPVSYDGFTFWLGAGGGGEGSLTIYGFTKGITP